MSETDDDELPPLIGERYRDHVRELFRPRDEPADD